MLHGLYHLSFWKFILVTLVLTHLTIISVTVFLHRCQAHRALQLHSSISHLFRLWLWLTTGMITKEWVAVHRKHHAKVEQPEDPHSPQVYGIWQVLFNGVGLYRKEAQNQATITQYGASTPDDWLERHVYSRFNTAGLFILLGVYTLLFGVVGIVLWGIQMLWIPLMAAGVINGIGHFWGYRNFESVDTSRNIVPWGILIGGEELHNNHHAFPASAKLAAKWWEFDLGWFYIRLMAVLRLAKIKRAIPKVKLNATKLQLDADSLSAVLTHRMQVMDKYWRNVIRPVLIEERQKASKTGRKLFRRARKLFRRDDRLLCVKQQERLHLLLQAQQRLQVVYQYKLQLQHLWRKAAGNQKEMLEHLRQWCHQAEQSGIRALEEFAAHLKHYTLAVA